MRRDDIEEALATLGDLLVDAGQAADVFVVGGSSLLLLGHGVRPTADVDLAALVVDDALVAADRLPEHLEGAVRRVGVTLDLGRDWVDLRAAGLIDLGLPDGALDRASVRRFGSLVVRLPSRADLIALKLLAAAVLHPANGKHLEDLVALAPSADEVEAAARWATDQDPSAAFASLLAATRAQMEER